jgi:hypothetical protein
MNVKYAVLWKDEDESEITIRYSTAKPVQLESTFWDYQNRDWDSERVGIIDLGWMEITEARDFVQYMIDRDGGDSSDVQ